MSNPADTPIGSQPVCAPGVEPGKLDRFIVVAREPLRTHRSQVILLLRELPATRVDLPTPKRGTIVVWQTESGELATYPPEVRLRKPGEWYLRPNDQRSAMACRRGACFPVVRFD